MIGRELLSLLEGVRRSGSGWIARCPAHGDRSPSLSIGESDGKILIHCFAGCSVESICTALKIRVSELFTEPRASRKPKPPLCRAVERQIAGLRSHLTRRERERPVTVVIADHSNLDAALARGLALAVEGEIVQVIEGIQ